MAACIASLHTSVKQVPCLTARGTNGASSAKCIQRVARPQRQVVVAKAGESPDVKGKEIGAGEQALAVAKFTLAIVTQHQFDITQSPSLQL